MSWQRIKDFAASATGRLAASYLLVIMAMSIGYSAVLYTTSVRALQHQIPPPSMFDDRLSGSDDNPGSGSESGSGSGRSPRVNEFLTARVAEGRQELVMRLMLLNVVTLILGGGLSYYLARRTLKPIEDSVEAQSQFVSDASHELRTPLTTIRTSNEVALRDKGLTLGQSKTLLRQNLEEADKLQSLTDGLLKLARGDADTLDLRAVSLQDAANEAMNRVLSQAQANKIAIDDAVPDLQVLADHAGLVQAIVILLDNATKYSPSGSTVKMQAVKKGKSALFMVRDQGPGIRPYDLRRIFDRFYRADQSRSGRNVSGHGIGLSLAKKLVEQQGGEIVAKSVVGKGSLFSIVLPLAK